MLNDLFSDVLAGIAASHEKLINVPGIFETGEAFLLVPRFILNEIMGKSAVDFHLHNYEPVITHCLKVIKI
jgi:hypothetical protein